MTQVIKVEGEATAVVKVASKVEEEATVVVEAEATVATLKVATVAEANPATKVAAVIVKVVMAAPRVVMVEEDTKISPRMFVIM